MKKKTTVSGPAALSLSWVPVTLPDGRTRMEMRWHAPARVERLTLA